MTILVMSAVQSFKIPFLSTINHGLESEYSDSTLWLKMSVKLMNQLLIQFGAKRTCFQVICCNNSHKNEAYFIGHQSLFSFAFFFFFHRDKIKSTGLKW